MTAHDNKMTLLQLNSLVRQVVETSMKGPYWVEAELSGINERGGHCYMELIELNWDEGAADGHAAVS